MTLVEYQKYNKQFREKYIYRLGGWTGFFSEYNNMVLAIFYCIVNKKQFVLQSRKANFSSYLGWNEFFLQFCDEVYDEALDAYNFRVKRPINGSKKKLSWFLYSKIYHHDYHYTYEFFDKMRSFFAIEREYDIPELNLHGNLRECCSEIHQMVWHYNQETAEEIERLISGIHLPKEYCGMHIRQGDKIVEAEVYASADYMKMLQQHTECKDIFVLTDDYRVMQELRTKFPQNNFYTLCQETERGYDYDKLKSMPIEEQRLAFLRLWASMDILERGQLFVGTFSANPGMNMGFRFPEIRTIWIDTPEWRIW